MAKNADDTDEAVRCWLVDRSYDDRGLVRLVYATPDGERAYRREISSSLLSDVAVTAARRVKAARLEPVTDAETRERYAGEAARVRENHDPDEEI